MVVRSSRFVVVLFTCLLLINGLSCKQITESNCEVCVKFVRRLTEAIPDEDRKHADKVKKAFLDVCQKAVGKDETLCFYLGGLETSATNTMNNLIDPITWHMPAEKVCEKLNDKDSQICDLRYVEKALDLKEMDLKKARVKDLKKILDMWDVQCLGCTEKSEFIKLIQEKMPLYDPEAAAYLKKKEDL